MSEPYNPPSAYTLHLRYEKILKKLFAKRPGLKAQFQPTGHSSKMWENSLSGRLALHFCAAREMYWGEIGYTPNGKAPPIPPVNMNLYVYQILLNQEPLFDRVSPPIRREWNRFLPFYAALRDHETFNDRIIRKQLQNARRRAARLRLKGLPKRKGGVRPPNQRKGPPNHPRLF